MNQYHIRIDGEQSTDSYTYQELVDMGLFDLDADSLNGIEVKGTTNSYFTPLKLYCFPERQFGEDSYYVDEYGQIHRKDLSQINDRNDANIDECWQVIRQNSPNHPSPNTYSSTRTTYSDSSYSNSNDSSGSDGWTIFWKIIASVLIIGIVIAISAGTNGYGTPIIFGGIAALRGIWKQS